MYWLGGVVGYEADCVWEGTDLGFGGEIEDWKAVGGN